MKALKFLFPVLFLLFLGTIKTEAQSQVQYIEMEYNGQFWYDCNGVIDYLIGRATVKVVFHFSKSGELLWLKAGLVGGELTSQATGEVFRVQVNQHDIKYMKGEDVIGFSHVLRLRGDMGTHVICNETFIYDPETGEFVSTIHKHKCM